MKKMDKITELRKDKSMSQKDLADLVGVSQVTISNIESGKKWASYYTLEKIANVLGVTLKDLL